MPLLGLQSCCHLIGPHYRSLSSSCCITSIRLIVQPPDVLLGSLPNGIHHLHRYLLHHTAPLNNLAPSIMSTVNVDLSSFRAPYKEDTDVFLEKDLPTTDPVQLFHIWFNEVKESKSCKEPNAVCLSTATKNGISSSRMVLLKQFGSDGFTIFTNLSSRKGIELKENPNAALLFYWDHFNRQVRIEGKVEFVSEAEATQYFQSRPKKSQIGAAISDQSRPIESRDKLVERYHDLEQQYADQAVLPKPADWGGIRIIPHRWEFWVGQSSRVHDRICFLKDEHEPTQWTLERLQP